MENGNLVSNEDMKDSALINNSSQNFDGSWIQFPQVNLSEALRTLPDLGLKLSKTPSFLDEVDQLEQGYNFNGGGQANASYSYAIAKAKSKDILQEANNKMKAENFPISLLKIGSWQRVSKNEGDLVAKCYFAKKKLVWEFLENGLKSKIEIQWSDILSLRAVMQEGQSGILEIELNQPPSFHHEIDPQPRKHTQWRMVSDFTGGQALTIRRHYLAFPPGALDRPLEKLLTYDNRLFQLSQQSYPTLKSPFFEKYTFGGDFSFDFGGQLHINPQHQQFSFSNVVPTPHSSLTFKDSDSPISVMDFSHIDQHGNNQMPRWGQDNLLIANQVRGRSFNVGLQPNSTVSFLNNHVPAYVQQASISQSQMHPILVERHQPMFQTLNNHQNMVLHNSQTEFLNSITEGNINNVIAYGQNLVDNTVVMSQVINWPQSQVHLLPSNNSSYCSSDPTMEHLHDVNHEISDWTQGFNHGYNNWTRK